jgi:hypothetical protein
MPRSTLTLLLVLVAATTPSGLAQTTTHTAETANNTSACSGVGLPDAHCKGPFAGMSSTASGTYERPPGHVSPLSVHQLLYSGNTTKIFAAYEPWFTVCHTTAASYPALNPNWTGTPEVDKYLKCNNHVETGYASNDAQTVDDQVSDMIRRGFDGIEINWYGQPTGCPSSSTCNEDGTTLKFRDNLENRCVGQVTCSFQYNLLIDQGTFQYVCPNGTSQDPNQPTCILNKLNSDLDYANTNYFGSKSFLKVSSRPVISYFLAESSFMTGCSSTAPCNLPGATCTSSADCWSKVWSAVRTHANGLSHGSPLIIFRNSGGFTHVPTDGSFAWDSHYLNYSGCTSTTDPNRKSDDLIGLCYLDQFYNTALGFPSLETWGGGWQGFDDTAAVWTQNRHETQECGQTWLLSMAEENHNPGSGPYYSTSRQLPFLHVVTWNDYDEGTAMEPGIDNCWAVSAAVAGSTLSWSLAVSSDQPNAATWASESTIDHYAIYDSADGENLTLVASSARGTRSVDLSTLPLGCGARTLYVEAVGMPSIVNKISPAVSYTNPNCGAVAITSPGSGASVASPFHLVANETTTRSADSLVANLDGKDFYVAFKTDTLDINVAAAPGSHTLQVKAWYSDGSFAKAQLTFTVSSAAAVTITSPIAGGSFNTPLRVLANENTSKSATSFQVFLDGVAGPSVASDSLDTSIEVTPGSHTVDVKATYGDGTSNTATATFTVRTGAVTVTSPTAGSTVSSPVHVVANESSSASATAMKVYLDNVVVYSISNSDTVDTTISAAPGAHEIIVKAWYADGTLARRVVDFTVQ